jgi:hypothetical protein
VLKAVVKSLGCVLFPFLEDAVVFVESPFNFLRSRLLDEARKIFCPGWCDDRMGKAV